MANYNRVLLMGNLTKDPELKYVQSGAAVANLRMAINRSYRTQSGEERKDVCYVGVVVWQKTAENVAKYLHKGSPLFVEGRLQSRSWETDDGQKRSILEVVADRVQFLGSPRDGGSDSGGEKSAPDGDAPPDNGSAPTQEPDFDGADDVPF